MCVQKDVSYVSISTCGLLLLNMEIFLIRISASVPVRTVVLMPTVFYLVFTGAKTRVKLPLRSFDFELFSRGP